MVYISPRLVDVLVAQHACHRAIAEIRLSHASCPYCGSSEIKGSYINKRTNGTRDFLVCRECYGRFSYTSGTFLMGARLPLIRYAQAFVLVNALGATLAPAAACLALGIRTPRVVSMIVKRIRLVDPGIRFTTRNADLVKAQRMYATGASDYDNFLIFCETNSILVDESQFLESLKIAINTPVPELVAIYKLRGQRNSNPAKPTSGARPNRSVAPSPPDVASALSADERVANRKAVALAWQHTFAQIVPLASSKLRVKLAWHLANRNVNSTDSFASMREEALVYTSSNPAAFIDLRSQYLEALPRLQAIKAALAKRAAERTITR